MSALTQAETFGRRFMMDIGLGAFLDKFEEHAGKSATKCLVVLIGFAIALVCANLIWATAIRPVIDSAISAFRSGGIVALGLQVVGMGIAVALGFGACLLTYGTIVTWRLKRVYQDGIDKLEDMLADAEKRTSAPLASDSADEPSQPS